jgi:hypothetical protein
MVKLEAIVAVDETKVEPLVAELMLDKKAADALKRIVKYNLDYIETQQTEYVWLVFTKPLPNIGPYKRLIVGLQPCSIDQWEDENWSSKQEACKALADAVIQREQGVRIP